MDDLIFKHDDNKMWVAITENGKVSVNVRADKTVIYHTREESFEDLYEAIRYIGKLTGQRPLFEMDEKTSNTRVT